MTNEKLKKWLKHCGSTDSLCDGCPFGAHELCFDEIKLAALALIKSKKKKSNSSKPSALYLTTNCAMRGKKQLTY